MRVIFTAQDPKTIRDAFAAAKPNAAYQNLHAAAVARQQSDQIYNLSLTRTATVFLGRGQRAVIGVGRVKTPTLAIVCRRELEIRAFRPQTYSEVVAVARVASGTFLMRHAPPEKLLKQEDAALIAAQADGFTGPLTVKVEESGRRRRGCTTCRRSRNSAVLASAGPLPVRWRSPKSCTMGRARSSSPTREPSRAIARKPDPGCAEDRRRLTGGEKFGALPMPPRPVIRRGKQGHFWDKGLEGVSHHAIIPNVNVVGDLRAIWARLSADERWLFMIIARSYLAALMPDFPYRQTTALLDVHGHAFRAVGRQPIEIGWRPAFGENAEPDGDEGGQMLPPLRNGEPASLSASKVEAKETQPPPRYNEGTLIEAMANAWRFVENPEHRERLKEAKGIGTPATRAEIIQGLKRQEFLVASGNYIVPTERGLMLFDVLGKADQALVDPAVTAKLEFLLDEVLYGRRRAEEAIDAVCGQASRIIGRLRDGTSSDGIPLPAVSLRPVAVARSGDKNPRRKARPAGSLPQGENGQTKIPRRRARPAAAEARSSVPTAETASALRKTAKRLKAFASATGKAADRGARDVSAPGPAKRGVSRGKAAHGSIPSGEVRQSAAGHDGTRLNIPFGNKELAMSLGARYRTGGWFAPPGTRLGPFQEKGRL